MAQPRIRAIYIYAVALAVGLAACAAPPTDPTTSSDTTDGRIPEVIPVPLAPGTVLPAPDPVTGYKSYATTSGGSYSVASVQSTAFANTGPTIQSFNGFTTDADSAYALIKSTTSGITNLELWKRRRLDSLWTVTCRFLDDGKFGKQIAVDGTTLYVYNTSSAYRSASLRKYNLLTCAAMTSLTVTWGYSASSYFASDQPYFGVKSGLVWFYETSSGASQNQTRTYSPAMLSFTSTMEAITLGTASLFSTGRSFALGNLGPTGQRDLWTLSDSNTAYGKPFTVWRYSASVKPHAWSYLPAADFPSLDRMAYSTNVYNSQLGFISSYQRDYVVVAVPSTTDLQLYWIDVTSF
ncbi:MAG: hypothetical protein IPJ84_15230 [Bdellovibrionales bacterium]|nr:hypothetical protein [Bdellovibrionales bacterium]